MIEAVISNSGSASLIVEIQDVTGDEPKCELLQELSSGRRMTLTIADGCRVVIGGYEVFKSKIY